MFKNKVSMPVVASSGGDFNVKVEKIESGFSGSGGGGSPYWDRDSYENRIIEPNKHYDTGFSTIICYQFGYNTKKLETNQFIIPLASYYTVGPGKRRIKFGEVELELNTIETKYNLSKETDTYRVDTTFYLTYTVVTPGTTGDTVQLPAYFNGAGPRLSYEVVTLGLSEA